MLGRLDQLPVEGPRGLEIHGRQPTLPFRRALQSIVGGCAGERFIGDGEGLRGRAPPIIQERSHAFPMKSQLWLLDPRPNLRHLRMVEKGFELSELRIRRDARAAQSRACHCTAPSRRKNARRGSRAGTRSRTGIRLRPRLAPPATYAQEKHRSRCAGRAAVKFIPENRLKRGLRGTIAELGIHLPGRCTTVAVRALQQLGLADAFRGLKIPIYVLNVTTRLSGGGRRVLAASVRC